MATLEGVSEAVISPMPEEDRHQSPNTLCVAPPNTEILFESELKKLDSSVSTAGSKTSIALTIKDPLSFPTLSSPPSQFNYKRGIQYLVFFGAVVLMYPSLTQLAQLKFQSKHYSPFETHAFLSFTSVVAYATAIPVSVFLFYAESSEESSIKQCFSPPFYMLLKSVFFLFVILAPLSLVLVLLIPCGFDWVGYSIVFALLVVVSVCAFTYYNKFPGESDSKLVVRSNNESSSLRSAVTTDGH